MLLPKEALFRIPFVRMLIPFIAGIVTGLILPRDFSNFRMMILIQISVIALLFLAGRLYGYQTRWMFGVFAHAFLLIAGFSAVMVNNHAKFRAQEKFDSGAYIVQLIDQPVELQRSYRIIVKAKAHYSGDDWRKCNFKLLAYFEKDALVEQLEAGSYVRMTASPEIIKPSGNPYEFNYGQYLTDRGIYGRVYVPVNEWSGASYARGFSVIAFSANLRSQILELLKDQGLSADQLAIASALLVGERDYVDEDLRESLTGAGIMHVMAVSGLHVGIIYLVLHYVLFFLIRLPSGRFIRAILIIVLLWMYAFLTGLSPSVMRAATMFSFVVFGQGIRRSGNVYNNLAASAFTLLCINPFFLRTAGFLLSYFAVTGIVFFYPRIYGLWNPRYWLPDKIWMLVSLSLSAQLGTAPLVLFYFHQFPSYFLISNIIAIPLVSGILYTGFLSIICSFAAPLAHVLSLILKFLINCFLYLTGFISHLPGSVMKPIFISGPECLLLYVLILLLVIFFLTRKATYLNLSLLAFITFTVMGVSNTLRAKQQRVFTVLNVSGTTAIQVINGQSACILITDTSSAAVTGIEYSTFNAWNKLRIKEDTWIDASRNMYSFSDGRLFRIKNGLFQVGSITGYFSGSEDFPYDNAPDPLRVQVVILSAGSCLNPWRILEVFSPELIILDSSIPWYRRQFLRTRLTEEGLTFHDVIRDGAYALKFDP